MAAYGLVWIRFSAGVSCEKKVRKVCQMHRAFSLLCSDTASLMITKTPRISDQRESIFSLRPLASNNVRSSKPNRPYVIRPESPMFWPKDLIPRPNCFGLGLSVTCLTQGKSNGACSHAEDGASGLRDDTFFTCTTLSSE
jgi:hypothetical protein